MFFNIAGPCIPGEHYLVPTLARVPELSGLIAKKQYFVIHAARQSGKTTLLNALEQELNAKGQIVALYCSLETAQGITGAEKGIPAVMRAVLSNCEIHPLLGAVPLPPADMADFTNGVKRLLFNLATAAGKPLVVLFDEADCLSGATLISFCLLYTSDAADE